MSRRSQLIISITCLLFLFMTPYLTMVQSQDLTIVISPIPPNLTTQPPEYTFPPELFDGYSAFSDRTPRIDGAINSGFNYKGQSIQGEWDDAIKIDFILNITQIARETKKLNATLYLKNDFINLYCALVIFDEYYNEGRST